MKWNGIVSQYANQYIATRLSAEKTAHPMSSARGLYGQRSATRRAAARLAVARRFLLAAPWLPGDELIAFTPHRLDQVEAEFGPQPPDAYVHHVGARVEVIAPDGGEQRFLGDGLADVLGELTQQQELQAGQRHRALADVGDQPSDVEGHMPCLDHLSSRAGEFGAPCRIGRLWPGVRVHVRLAAQLHADPGQQFGERE